MLKHFGGGTGGETGLSRRKDEERSFDTSHLARGGSQREEQGGAKCVSRYVHRCETSLIARHSHWLGAAAAATTVNVEPELGSLVTLMTPP